MQQQIAGWDVQTDSLNLYGRITEMLKTGNVHIDVVLPMGYNMDHMITKAMIIYTPLK